MADVTVTYNGQNILEMSATGRKTLKTAKKRCKTDIEVVYVKPGGGGGDVEPLLPSQYQRVEFLQFEPSVGIIVTIPTIGYVCYAADMISTKTNSSEDYSIVFGFRESSSGGRDFELGATYQAVYSWIRSDGTDTGLEMYHNESYTPGNRETVYITLKNPRSTALIGRYAYYNSSNVNSEAFRGKFYSLKGTNIETNQTVAWFVPCYRKSDNQVGVYDHIAQSFFWQTFATGSNYGITAGPDVN